MTLNRMYYYIVNPAAGGGKINKIQDRLKERLKRLGIMGEFVKSTGPGDVAKLAKLGVEKGFKTIVAVGGDSTINEVMNAIIGSERVALGIIPTSNTNELALALGITDWYAATGILAARKVEEVDLGRVGDRFFVTSVSVGFEPRVAQIRALAAGNLPTRMRYFLGMFKESTTYRPVSATLKFDGNYEVEAECFNIMVSNAQFSTVKHATIKPNDSLLDTVVITKIPPSKILKYSYLSDTSAIDLPKISVFHSKKIEIVTREPVDVSIDGQTGVKTPIVMRIADKKLRVIVSRKRKF